MDQAENPIGLTADFDERREMPRCAVDVPVTLLVLSRGTTIVGQMAELSLSGCRVLLPKTLPHAASAAVECTFRIRGVAFRLGGVVEWAESNLAGVRFSAMSSRSRDNLMEVLCEVELENHARQLASPNTTPEPHTVGMHPVEPVPAESAVRGPARSRPGTLDRRSHSVQRLRSRPKGRRRSFLRPLPRLSLLGRKLPPLQIRPHQSPIRAATAAPRTAAVSTPRLSSIS